MKRQKIRKGLTIISFLLFPITLYYFSPYLIIYGASQGIITGSFAVFSMMLFGSLFFGRSFCGYICPAGGLSECMMLANPKQTKPGKRDYIKYVIWSIWIVMIVMVFVGANGVHQVDFFFQTTHGISVVGVQGFAIYYGVLFLIVSLSLLTGKRGFCHYVCWMAPFMVIGSVIKEKVGIPSLRIKANSEKCIDCKKCDKQCPMSLPVSEMVKKESMFEKECILCGECVDSCPKKVISYSLKK